MKTILKIEEKVLDTFISQILVPAEVYKMNAQFFEKRFRISFDSKKLLLYSRNVTYK